MRIYGNIAFSGGTGPTWSIHAEPHVMIRLKRVFPRARENGPRGFIRLSDTTDVRRDIAWMLDRYPLDISKKDRARLEIGGSLSTEVALRLLDELEAARAEIARLTAAAAANDPGFDSRADAV
ncbi:MAG TPA: hypothetical protein VGM56_17850, partial [Byssovorax sp.]